MDYRSRSLFSICLFASLALGMGIVLNFVGGPELTGAVVSCVEQCQDVSDCDDYNPCTVDTCVLESCGSSCNHEPQTQCINNDKCCPLGCAGQDNDC